MSRPVNVEVDAYRHALVFSSHATPDELAEVMRAMLLHETMQAKLKKFEFVNMNRVVLHPAPKKLLFTFHFMPRNGIGLCGFARIGAAPACEWLNEPVTDAALSAEFERMDCPIDDDNPAIKAGLCARGKPRPKLFYRRARSLHDYAQKLSRGVIPDSDHNDIFTIISRWQSFENHNMDIPLLHFK